MFDSSLEFLVRGFDPLIVLLIPILRAVEQVGKRFAGAGAGLDDQVAAILEGLLALSGMAYWPGRCSKCREDLASRPPAEKSRRGWELFCSCGFSEWRLAVHFGLGERGHGALSMIVAVSSPSASLLCFGPAQKISGILFARC